MLKKRDATSSSKLHRLLSYSKSAKEIVPYRAHTVPACVGRGEGDSEENEHQQPEWLHQNILSIMNILSEKSSHCCLVFFPAGNSEDKLFERFLININFDIIDFQKY